MRILESVAVKRMKMIRVDPFYEIFFQIFF